MLVARAKLTSALASALNQEVKHKAMVARPGYALSGARDKRPWSFNTVIDDVVSTTVVGKVVNADLGEAVHLCIEVASPAPFVVRVGHLPVLPRRRKPGSPSVETR